MMSYNKLSDAEAESVYSKFKQMSPWKRVEHISQPVFGCRVSEPLRAVLRMENGGDKRYVPAEWMHYDKVHRVVHEWFSENGWRKSVQIFPSRSTLAQVSYINDEKQKGVDAYVMPEKCGIIFCAFLALDFCPEDLVAIDKGFAYDKRL